MPHTSIKEVFLELKKYFPEWFVLAGVVMAIEWLYLSGDEKIVRYMACSLVVIPAIVLDYFKHRLYDWLTLMVFLAGILVNFYTYGATMNMLWNSLAGVACLGGIFTLVLIFFFGKIGLGDIKFAIALGTWLSWEEALIAFCLTFYIGFMVAVKHIIKCYITNEEIETVLPLGPAMAMGVLLAMILGQRLWEICGNLI